MTAPTDLASLRNGRRLPFAASLTILLFLTVPGCGGGGDAPGEAPSASEGPSTSAESGVSSTVVVDGSSTVFRVSRAAQEAFAEVNSEITVVVDSHGTGGGFGRYLQGEVDVVDASRDAKPDEAAKAKAQGIEWTRFLVGYDGITVVVHPQNTFVQSLTVDQLKRLWSPGSTVKTWRELNPAWPARKIVLYSPDNDSGTFEFFTEAVVGKAGAQRTDVQQNSDDNSLVNGVAGDTDGLGYFGYAYFAANKEKLRAVPVQDGENAKPVLPSPETVLDKSYRPLSRPLYIFVKNSSLRKGSVASFVKYYLENVVKLSEEAGYVAPTADDRAANVQSLRGAGVMGLTDLSAPEGPAGAGGGGSSRASRKPAAGPESKAEPK